MSDEFCIPAKPADLLNEDADLPIKVRRLQEFEEAPATDIDEYAEGALYDISNQDALCIIEQDLFDRIFSIIGGFKHMSSISRTRLVDGLCSNLSVLSLSIGALTSVQEPDDPAEHEASCASHRSALKAYVFFLSWLTSAAEDEEKAAVPEPTTVPGRAKGRKKAAGAQALLQWDWDGQRGKIARSLAVMADIDLWKLYRPKPVEGGLLQTCSRTAQLLLESAQAMKSKVARDGAFAILTACALRYGQLEAVAGAAVAALTRNEHLASVLAELAAFCEAKYHDERLGAEMLQEVAAVSPHEYERQQKDDLASSGGVRNVAKFVESLADRCPKLVANRVSLLMAHLGGKAYSLRSAIVTAIGTLVQKAFENAPGEDADAQGTRARLRAKQGLLATLVERCRDGNAYTRARTLQTWAALAEAAALPLGHWVCITQLAAGRLEDKSSIVRKAALQLLAALLQYNPFGGELPEGRFEASLAEWKAKLKELAPEGVKVKEDPFESGEAEEAADASPQVKAEPEDAAMDGGAAVGLGEGAGADGALPEEDEHAQMEVPQEEAVQMPATQDDPVAANVTQTRALVASLEAAVAFVRALSGALPVLVQLLASATVSDVHDSIALLMTYSRFGIAGAQDALRKMLPLVFSFDQAIKDNVISAVDDLYIARRQPQDAAQCLIDITLGSNMGELAALEEIVGALIKKQPEPLLKPIVIKALAWLCDRAHQQACAQGAAAAEDEHRLQAIKTVRGAMSLLAMVAVAHPDAAVDQLDTILEVGFSQQCPDALTRRSACAALSQLACAGARLPDSRLRAAHEALTGALVAPGLPEAGWYGVAEATVSALYTVHPQPAQLCEAVLRSLAKSAMAAIGEGGQDDSSLDATALSHFFFVLGQVALQHLVHVEALAKSIRRQAAAKEKAIAEASAGGAACGQAPAQGSDEKDDIAAQLGAGSAASDAELDRIKDATEAEILGRTNLVGRFAPLVAAFCHQRRLRDASPTLRASALLALCKLMCLDAAFCDTNLQLIFTLLHNREIEAGERSNLIIAVGDLALRFPNLLEPWTAHIYQPLSDPDTGMRKTCLMVLSHLILNDMMKVKGHIARLALCLQDGDPRVAGLAQVFFHELSRKAFKGTNPIYNLLPDIFSSLSAETQLPSAHFQAIMKTLLGYIGRDKHADSLVEKLMLRFETAATPAQWRNLAFCLTQLSLTEKGLRKMMEMSKSYRHALLDSDVLDLFKAICAKARKLSKQSAELKDDLEAFEAKLDADAAEVAEEHAAARAARKQAGGDDDDGEEKEDSQDEAMEGGDAADGSETAAGIAAVEGLLSGLALSESAAEQPAAPKATRQAAPGGEVQEPNGTAEPAAAAADDMLEHANAAGDVQAQALTEDPQPAQADPAEEDEAKTSVQGGDRLVAEAERQLAQLQLSVGKNPGAKKPLTEAVPEKGPVAEEPKFTRSRAGRAAKENRRSSASASAAAAHSGGSAQKGAAGVSAMRAFWEKAGQPAEKPRAGAKGLPHQAAAAEGTAAKIQQPASKAVQDWSDDD